ncbi:hypothetical protein Tco_1284716 [Tanacetum coccineum]
MELVPNWKATSVPPLDPSPSSTTNKVEVPKELPKVSMVNTSLKELKRHLPGFVSELKDIFQLSINQYLVDELANVQNVFYQMEHDVEQHRLESRTFEVKMNQVLSENERLLAQAIDHDIVKTVVNLSVNDGCETVNECQKTRVVLAALKNKLRKLKGKALDKEAIETHSVDPKVSKDNMEPITPKLLNKRTAHSSYIKHTQEEALVLRDIVEHVKANYPQDLLLESAFRKPKKNKNTESLSKTEVIKTISANKQEPSKSWGSIKTNVPSSSLNGCRLSKSSSVIWTPVARRHMTGVPLHLTISSDKFLV